MHRLARAFELTVSYFGISVLLALIVATNTVPTSFAATTATVATNSACSTPAFYSLDITPAILNASWSVPLLSTIDGQYAPTVTATGLPPGITLQDEKTTLAAGGSTLHNWVLSGAPTMLGTYTITVTAQNSCGGVSTVITLPINNTATAAGTVACPAGTVGTYPNCVSSTAPTVAFDTNSLTATTPDPTITGISNTQTVSLSVQNNTGNIIYNSPTTSVVGGKWSIQLSNLLSGLYTLNLYSNGTLLVPAKLNVTLSSTVVPATPATPAASVVTTPATTSSTSSGSSQCPAISVTMQIGGSGTAVVALQNFLISKGLLAQGSATGYFGTLTQAAVEQFQRQQGIVSSGTAATTGFGVVGARTRAAIQASCTTTASPSSSTSVQPLTQLASCPAIPVPACQGGTLISLGADTNHCSLGYVCKQSVASLCPQVTEPTCTHGYAVPSGTDANGCTTGYSCQSVSCPSINVVTSCPAGETLISGNDQYGCPNVSYCSGTPDSSSSGSGTSLFGACNLDCISGYHPSGPAGSCNQTCVPD